MGSSGSSGGGAIAVIARSTLTVAAPSVDFTGIPSTYKNLLVDIYARTDANSTQAGVFLLLNGDTTAAHYSYSAYGQIGGAAPESLGAGGGAQIGIVPAATSVAGTFGGVRATMSGYSEVGSTKAADSLFGFATASGGYPYLGHGGFTWTGTAAVDEVTVTGNGANLQPGTVITLYGQS